MKNLRLGKRDRELLYDAIGNDWLPAPSVTALIAIEKMKTHGLVETRRRPGKILHHRNMERSFVDLRDFIPADYIPGQPLPILTSDLLKNAYLQQGAGHRSSSGAQVEYRLTEKGKAVADLYKQSEKTGKPIRWDRTDLA